MTEPRTPESLVNELMAIWGSGEVERLSGLMAPDVLYEDVPNNRVLQGIDAAVDYVNHVHTWASDVTLTVRRSFGNETEAVAEWTMTATQSNPIPGRVPVATQRQITLQGTTMIHVQDGRIARAVDYMDALGLVLQLGSEVRLPGDAILKLPD